MKRGIIAAMEEYEGTDPNDLDFSDFEPVMDPSEGSLVSGGLDEVLDTVDIIDTHDEITDIIATEGLGNRPQIAAIALSALETKLFGQPVVGTRVGTESNIRIASEGKNILARAWDAILKFINKISKWFKSFFTSDKKDKVKKKKKQIKEAIETIVESHIIEAEAKAKANEGSGTDTNVGAVASITIPPAMFIGVLEIDGADNPSPDGLVPGHRTGDAIKRLRQFFFKEMELKAISDLVKKTSSDVLDYSKEGKYDEVEKKLDALNELLDFTKQPNISFPGFLTIKVVANNASIVDLKAGFAEEVDNLNSDISLKAQFLAGIYSNESNRNFIEPLCDEIINRAPQEKQLEDLIEETRKSVTADARKSNKFLHTDSASDEAKYLLGYRKTLMLNILAMMSAYSKYIISEYNMLDAIHQVGTRLQNQAEKSGKDTSTE